MDNYEDMIQELEHLRAYKAAQEGKALNRAFARLEQLLSSVSFDPVISLRAFRVIADCLLTLRDEINHDQRRIK
jgi:hypothetical protein